jgi:hypothetical protein
MSIGIDAANFYSGSLPNNGFPGGQPANLNVQSLTAGTSYSTAAICHNQGYTPSGSQQNVQPLVGEPQSLVLQVTALPGDVTATASYIVNFLTDLDATMTNAPVTLATLTIPKTVVAGTYFVLPLTGPTLGFLLYSGLKFVLTSGTGTATLGVSAWIQPSNSIPADDIFYQSGWVIQNQ